MAVQIQLRRGTAAAWAAANPILADGEIGVESDNDLYKIGDGATAWNDLEYGGITGINTATVIDMTGQGSTPSVPAPGNLKIYSKSLGGRMLLRQIGPSGVASPLQPSFFQNNIVMINTGATTVLGTFGMTVTSVGTVSHPAPTEAYGYMANIASAATLNATAGTGNLTPYLFLGSTPGANGFFFNARLAYPDASYNETGVATTGSRAFVGLTDQTMAVAVGNDSPAGNHCGFQRCSVNGARIDTNWQFMTKDGTTQNLVDTGLPFLAQKVYDFFIFCAPQGTVLGWKIENLTDGTSAEGTSNTNLPANNVALRGGAQIATINAVSRNLRLQRIYIETDK